MRKTNKKGGLTRAVMSEEHYTIFALNSAGVRVATMKGKVKDGIFKRDTGSPKMELYSWGLYVLSASMTLLPTIPLRLVSPMGARIL